MAAYRGKRAVDLVFGLVACLAFAPIVCIIALAIWCEDRQSPLFTQVRVGRARRPFRILKCRTMNGGAVTRVGHWLRNTGLDELLQFLNVLRGEMSIVGPRPLTVEDIARLDWSSERYDWRFAMKPGITGLAQILGGRSARHSARLDRLYLRRQSALLDIWIIGLSFLINLAGKSSVRMWMRSVSGSRRAAPCNKVPASSVE